MVGQRELYEGFSWQRGWQRGSQEVGRKLCWLLSFSFVGNKRHFTYCKANTRGSSVQETGKHSPALGPPDVLDYSFRSSKTSAGDETDVERHV